VSGPERLVLPDRRLRLAFFGTPELAATILGHLLEAGQDDVVCVVCQPDKPRGRKRQVEAPPVKLRAEAAGLEVLQPTKMRDGSLARALTERRVELAVVAAYGRILTQDSLDAPTHGCWNVHASLLPRHRGASPIQHAILAGDAETGVDVMRMTAGLDEGPVLLERRLAIAPDWTAGRLSEALAELGGRAIVEAIARARAEGLEVRPQDDAAATYAPLIRKEDGHLDLRQPAAALARRVRAFDPWPGTFLRRPEGPLRILRAEASPGDGFPGRVVGLDDGLILGTGDGRLVVREVQPPGKRPMPVADFLRGAGRGLTVGDPIEPEDAGTPGAPEAIEN
jgi:methionyl-tRNA formyltransferase